MSEYRVAIRYAKSLLELAEEQGVLDEVHQDMNLFYEVCKQNRDLVLMLENPIIEHNKKKKILYKIFESKVNKITLLIFDIITRKNREKVLQKVAKEFHHLYNEHKGIEEAKVITAIKLDEDLKKEFKEIIKKISDKEIMLLEEVDKEIIGGFQLKISDRQIDDSVSTKLKELKLKFKQK